MAKITMTVDDDKIVTIREFEAALGEIRRAVDIAQEAAGSKVELREYVEALFEQQIRALEIAERERSKAADALRDESRRAQNLADTERSAAAAVLRDEQRRASEIAAVEREKSAEALRKAMSHSIEEGDARLHEHIIQQFQQITAALVSANSLEVERIDLVKTEVSNLDYKVAGLFEEKQKALDAALTAQKEAVVKAEVATDRIAARAQTDQEGLRADMQERLAAVRRELEQATAAQKEAVLKAEAANEKRFESTNEWRGQSQDRERSQAEQRAKLESTFVSREVVDVQFADIHKQLDLLQTNANLGIGRNLEITNRQARVQPWMIWAMTSIVIISVAVINVLIKL